jgi:hypothetical protein
MRMPEFDQKYRKACWDKFSQVTAQCQSVRLYAIATLRKVMRDGTTSKTTRVVAAIALLQLAAATLAEVDDLHLRVQRLTQPQPQPLRSQQPEFRKAA